MIDFSSKSVALVGNAESLLAAQHGVDIDSHDIVVRMNRGVPKDFASQGTRTDVLVFSVFSHVKKVYQQFNATAYFWMSPREREEALETGDLPAGTAFYSLDQWERLNASLGARPSVGAMALDMLSTMDVGSVSVFGFDFKRTKTTYLKSQYIGPHDYMREQEFCTKLLSSRNWRFFQDF